MDIDAVLRRGAYWFSEKKKTLRTVEAQNAIDCAARSFAVDVRTRPMVRDMSVDSLEICDLLCTVYSEWPPTDHLISFYERCSRSLLRNPDEDIEKLGEGTERSVMNYLHRKHFASELAYWMIRNNWLLVEREGVEAKLARMCEFRPPWNFSPLDVLQDLLVLRLLKEEDGFIAFTSRQLQIYYAACASAEQRDVGFLISNALQPQYSQIIVLVAGLLPSDQSEVIISGLILRGARESASRMQLHRLAASCLELAPTIVRERLQSLFTGHGNGE